VYLVAGTAWLNGVLERFQMMLAEFPCVLDLGEVTHEEASSKQECIASLTSLIGEILDDRERQGVFTPDITSGKHDIGRIRDDLPTAPIHGATRSLLSRSIRRQQS
jgi:hypothetical protein